MTIKDKLQEFKRSATTNDFAVSDDLTDLSSEVEVLCEAVEILSEALYAQRQWVGPIAVKNAEIAFRRVETCLGVKNE